MHHYSHTFAHARTPSSQFFFVVVVGRRRKSKQGSKEARSQRRAALPFVLTRTAHARGAHEAPPLTRERGGFCGRVVMMTMIDDGVAAELRRPRAQQQQQQHTYTHIRRHTLHAFVARARAHVWRTCAPQQRSPLFVFLGARSAAFLWAAKNIKLAGHQSICATIAL